MLDGKARELAQKISIDTARYVNDYYTAKIKRMAHKLGIPDAGMAAGYVYMAMLGGTVGVICSVIDGVATRNPDLAQKLKEDMAAKIMGAGNG